MGRSVLQTKIPRYYRQGAWTKSHYRTLGEPMMLELADDGCYRPKAQVQQKGLVNDAFNQQYFYYKVPSPNNDGRYLFLREDFVWDLPDDEYYKFVEYIVTSNTTSYLQKLIDRRDASFNGLNDFWQDLPGYLGTAVETVANMYVPGSGALLHKYITGGASTADLYAGGTPQPPVVGPVSASGLMPYYAYDAGNMTILGFNDAMAQIIAFSTPEHAHQYFTDQQMAGAVALPSGVPTNLAFAHPDQIINLATVSPNGTVTQNTTPGTTPSTTTSNLLKYVALAFGAYKLFT